MQWLLDADEDVFFPVDPAVPDEVGAVFPGPYGGWNVGDDEGPNYPTAEAAMAAVEQRHSTRPWRARPAGVN